MIRLKEILEEKHRTQVWLSEAIGVSVVSVNNWCQNKNEPSLKTLYRIAEVLNVKISEILIENKR